MINFVLICHKGELEYQALFLVWSIKQHLEGNYTIHVAIPKDDSLAPCTQSISTFSELACKIYYFNNTYIDKTHNELPGDKCSNKIFALKALNTEGTVIFLDSDILALQNFDSSIFETFTSIGIKPVNRIQNIQWEKLYSYFHLETPKSTVTTCIDKKNTYPYFNSGVIIIPQNLYHPIINAWEKIYLEISQKQLLEKNYFEVFFRDQVAFALAIQQQNIEYELLDEKYNFPIRGKKLPAKNLPYFIHYHRSVSIASYKKLRQLHQEYINEHIWTKKLMPKDWGFFFKTNIITRNYRILIEKLKYEKYLLVRKVKNANYTFLKSQLLK